MTLAEQRLDYPYAEPADAGRSLPAWIYRDPEFFALEREYLFMPAWHLVCHVCDIPRAGDYATFEILGELAVVVRGKDGVIRAFHNVCRHRAARVLDGPTGNAGPCIRCPYHAWTYARREADDVPVARISRKRARARSLAQNSSWIGVRCFR